MKSAVICGICEKPVKFSETYAVKLIDYSDPIQIDVTGQAKPSYVYPERKIRVCRADIKKMKYKVKAIKPKVKIEKKT